MIAHKWGAEVEQDGLAGRLDFDTVPADLGSTSMDAEPHGVPASELDQMGSMSRIAEINI